MFPQDCGELEEIIAILYDGDQSGTNGGFKDDDYLFTIMNNLLLEDHKNTEQVVVLLKEDFNKNEVYYVKLRASISIMLAYANCKLEDQRQVLYYAKTATSPFWHTNFWNRALVVRLKSNLT